VRSTMKELTRDKQTYLNGLQGYEICKVGYAYRKKDLIEPRGG